MPSIRVSQMFNFNHMKVTFSESVSYKDFTFAGVVLMPDKRCTPICSNCGNKSSSVHQTLSRIVRDLPLGTFKKPRINYV